MTPQEKLLNKIRNLMALGDVTRGASPEEAALAMAKAQELMTRHGIEMMDVAESDAPSATITHETVVLDRERKYDFDANVARIITQCFGVKIMWQKIRTMAGPRHCYLFIGQELDIALAKVALPLLIQAMRGGVAAFLKARKEKWTAKVGLAFYAGLEHGYVTGSAQGKARAYEQASKANADRYAIVLVDKEKAITKYTEETWTNIIPGKKPATRTKEWDGEAWEAGKNAGQALDLSGKKLA